MGVKLGKPCPACGSTHCTQVQLRAEAAEDKLYKLQHPPHKHDWSYTSDHIYECSCGKRRGNDGVVF